VILPRQPTRSHPSSSQAELSILRVLEFSSNSLRSGVVVVVSKGMPRGSALLFLKGAPSIIRQLVQSASVPSDFDQVAAETDFCVVHSSGLVCVMCVAERLCC